MQDFIVTRRAASGEREEVQYSAADRAELFSKLKAEGVTPISVREGKLEERKVRKSATKPSAAASLPAGAKPLSPMRGLVAGLIVIAGAAAVYYFVFMPKAKPVEEKSAEPAKSALIEEVAPVATQKVEVVTNVEEKLPDIPGITKKNREVLEARAKKYGLGGPVARVIKMGEGDPDDPNRFQQPVALFQNDSENIIDGMLSMKVGDRCYGEFDFKNFDDDFKKSLENVIVVLHDDSEEVAERKRAVIDAKIQLSDAMRDGESPLQRILETRQYLNQMADVRDQIQQEVLTQRQDSDMTPEEIEDLYAAANELLKKKDANFEPLISPKERKAINKARMRARREAENAANNQ